MTTVDDGPPKAVLERMLPGFVCMRWRPVSVHLSRALTIPRLIVSYYDGDRGQLTATNVGARKKECAATVPLRPTTKAKALSAAYLKRFRRTAGFEVLAETELPLGPATQHGVMVFGTPEVQRIARLVQYTTEGVGRDVHYLYRDETVVGREQGDLVFTDDPFMSRRHAAITVDRASRRFVLRDLGSSNGTAVRFRGERALRPGDQFRVGRHLFRFESGGAA